MKSKQDVSYGIIPIKREGDEWKVFVIHQYSRIKDNSYWVFPKGHPEGNETPQATAQRELHEETGMTADFLLDEPVFTLSYNFVFEDSRIEKRVTFFIGVLSEQNCVLCAKEVKEAGWFSLEEVADRLDYHNTKKMFAQAKKFIETYEGA